MQELHTKIKTPSKARHLMTRIHTKARKFATTGAKTMVITMLIGVMASSVVVQPVALADSYEEQIRKIEADNARKQSSVDKLQEQAESYQDAVSKLQAQINTLQSKIRKNQAQRDDLQKQIEIAQKELDKQRHILGENIKAMYVEGDITTLEMLASSKDLSEFFNKQQYRDSVQQKVKAALDKVNALKDKLREQKTLVEKLLADQKEINSQLTEDKRAQQKLLAYTDAQKSAFNSQIAKNNSKIADLRAAQIAANQSLGGSIVPGDPNRGGYPWANYRAGTWTHGASCTYGDDIDNWGLCYRQCVSYAAWKVYQRYGHMPYGFGDANMWPGKAAAAGIPTGYQPRKHSVATSMAGTWGHVMWVEEVYGNGQIRISEFNAGLTGQYSERVINGNGLIYIYFR